eukprot:TRINITY_DN2265_c0_g1_i2.p1 TRINITY_DN2265_c0_g1~~TRINITY_DN2265_c0_g1_i2.p1  ORF type:complete len:319 (-),score=95.12 TRINITY_DN2265_c0_g1_i2:67-1023(-)
MKAASHEPAVAVVELAAPSTAAAHAANCALVRAACAAARPRLAHLVVAVGGDKADYALEYVQACMVHYYNAALAVDFALPITVVPPLPATAQILARLPGIRSVISSSVGAETAARLSAANERRAAAGLEPIAEHVTVVPATVDMVAACMQPPLPANGGWAGQQMWADVCLGGTFDRLHAGHRMMLATAALVSSRRVRIGLTSLAMLRSKQNLAMIQPHEVREAHLRFELRAINPDLEYFVVPLTDPCGPALGVEDPAGIVVSPETIKGAAFVNTKRAAAGKGALAVVLIPFIPAPKGFPEGKLSSSALREIEKQPACH